VSRSKNAWSYTSTPPIVKRRDNFTFTLPLSFILILGYAFNRSQAFPPMSFQIHIPLAGFHISGDGPSDSVSGELIRILVTEVIFYLNETCHMKELTNCGGGMRL
jgi:hypothetical protein